MEEYLGFREVALSEEDYSVVFQQDSTETFGCLQNEYLIANDLEGNHIGLFKNVGGKMSKVPYKAIKSRFLGTMKPRNIQQQLAIDVQPGNNRKDSDRQIRVRKGLPDVWSRA